MLVLKRYKDEKIVVNGNIVITLIEITGRAARIGVHAPEGIPINREEIEIQKNPEYVKRLM